MKDKASSAAVLSFSGSNTARLPLEKPGGAGRSGGVFRVFAALLVKRWCLAQGVGLCAIEVFVEQQNHYLHVHFVCSLRSEHQPGFVAELHAL